MKNIVVPTDFSDNALKAVLYAAEIAKKNGAALFLLHVIEPVENNIREPFMLHERYLKETASARLSELDSVSKMVASAYPMVHIQTALAKGSIIDSIINFTNSNDVELIIMGTKGASGLKQVFIGSVAAGTIARTNVPVLAIPDEYIMEEPDAIFLATNQFEENKTVLNSIIELAKLFSATIHVAVFVKKNTADAAAYMNSARQLDHYISFLNKAFPGLVFKGELLDGNEFEETVEEYDEKHGVDIIAMITYPKGFWDRFLKRSATGRMTFHSRIPVLAVPANDRIRDNKEKNLTGVSETE